MLAKSWCLKEIDKSKILENFSNLSPLKEKQIKEKQVKDLE